MKLTLEITDEQLDAVKKALQVNYRDWRDLVVAHAPGHGEVLDSKVADYVTRIIHARQALQLAFDMRSICHNPPREQHPETITCS